MISGRLSDWEEAPGLSADRHLAWTEAFWQAIAPKTDGTYVNFLEDEGEGRIRAAYPPATHARLAEVKRRYDPTNLFRRNQNITPAR
ncbi:MAG: BBE domain-containing protein [Thermomicrobiales bacterium]